MVRHKKWKMCSRRATQNIEYYALNGHSPRFESASTVYVWGYHMLEAKLIYIKMEINTNQCFVYLGLYSQYFHIHSLILKSNTE